MQRWYVIQAKPRHEVTAEENLQRQGFEVYLPRLITPRRRRGKWQDAVEPLFPRYLFIHLEMGVDNTSTIRSTKGVARIVRFGEYPIPLPEGFVEFLRAHEDPERGAQVPDRPQFQAGDRVRILAGPFAGLEGIYSEPRGDQRVVVLLDLLGKQNRVAIERDHLISAGNT